MARVYSIPFETNSITNGVEANSISWNANVSGGNGMQIQTSTVRTGTYALRDVAAGGGDWFSVVNSSSHSQYMRMYMNISVTSGAEVDCMSMSDQGFTASLGVITITTGNQLKLYYNSSGTPTLIGTSSALSTGVFNMIELHVDDTGGAGSTVVEGRLNGVVFATRTGAVSLGTGGIPSGRAIIGNVGFAPSVTGTFFYDDIAINDASGSNQTGYPGPGALYVLRPSADGDSHAFTVQVGGTAGAGNNFTRVNEVTPNDLTSYNADVTSGDNDEFNIDDTPGGIGANDTINVVHVYTRYAGLSAVSDATFKARIKKAAAGTVQQGSAITPASTSFVTTYGITAYIDPDGNPYTKATLDTTQIGYGITTTGVNAAAITNTFLLVDVTPAVTTSQGGYMPTSGFFG